MKNVLDERLAYLKKEEEQVKARIVREHRELLRKALESARKKTDGTVYFEVSSVVPTSFVMQEMVGPKSRYYKSYRLQHETVVVLGRLFHKKHFLVENHGEKILYFMKGSPFHKKPTLAF